jgi:hypothetical protein
MAKTRGVTKESDKRYRKKSQKGAARAATLASSATATMKSTVPAPTDKRKASSKKQTAAPQLKKKAVPKKKAASQAKKKDDVSEGGAVVVAAPIGTHLITLDASTTGSPVRLIVGPRVADAAQERSVGHVGKDRRYHKMLTKAFNSPEGHAFFDSNDNENPDAVGQHSLAAFVKQPKEKQGLDWDAALRNEINVCDGLDSDVGTVLDSLPLKKAAAPENIYQHYEGFCDDPPPPPTTSSTSSLQFREIVSKTQMKKM